MKYFLIALTLLGSVSMAHPAVASDHSRTTIQDGINTCGFASVQFEFRADHTILWEYDNATNSRTGRYRILYSDGTCSALTFTQQ